MREKMSKQPPPTPTASTIGPCPTVIQVSRTPRHCKFTQHLRTTRPPLLFLMENPVSKPVDPDQRLHYLSMTLILVSRLEWVKLSPLIKILVLQEEKGQCAPACMRVEVFFSTHCH